jgi:lycopene beta-cyclase
MKNHAEAIVEALIQQSPIPKPYRKYRFRLYDRILLRILRETSQYGKEIFDRLLSKAPQALVLKFLDEQTTLFDEAKLFATLPKRLFLKNLWLELKWKK